MNLLKCLIIGIYLTISFWFSQEAISMNGMGFYKIAAWSEDGESVLLEASGFGPEGGGTFGYVLINACKGISRSYIFSNDMSPGDGSTPQWITIVNANRILNELKIAIKEAGFRGITIKQIIKLKPEGLSLPEDNRLSAVGIVKDHEVQIKKTNFKNDNNKRVLDRYTIHKNKNKLVLETNKHQKCVLLKDLNQSGLLDDKTEQFKTALEVYLSPSMKLLIFLINEKNWNGNTIGPVFYSPEAIVTKFKQVNLANSMQ